MPLSAFPIRPGIAFPHRHAQELVQLRPLVERLQDLLASPPSRARVVVLAECRAPRRRSWNVQLFAGFCDPEPRWLQRGLMPRLRAYAKSTARAPEAKPVKRNSRYEQVNAYGPRASDLLEGMLRDVEVSRHGHVALNELGGLRHDPDGPLVWMPSGGGRATQVLGSEVARLAPGVPVLARLAEAGPRGGLRKLGRTLAETRGVTLAPGNADPYRLLEGACALLTDVGSLALEGYCLGMPVGLVRAPGTPGTPAAGLEAELAARVPVFAPGDGLRAWAEAPPPPSDAQWARDLLYEPRRSRNDAFAAGLRERAVAMAI